MFGIKQRAAERRVAILGAGPAGVLAAQAAYERGYDPVIFSRPPLGDRLGEVAKSDLHGCQYLHAPVPNPSFAGGPGMPVNYTLRGTSDGYRLKVYGSNDSRIAVSPDEYGNAEPHMAWDLRLVYEKLWHRWAHKMRPMQVTPEEVQISLKAPWAKVVSTVPAPALCLDPAHSFESQNVWAMGQREGSQDFPFACPPFTVVCNGERDSGWYRMANVYGMTTVEWAMDRKPPIKGVVRVEKPLTTNCDCHLPEGLVRVGRFGKWQKGVLVHTAYTETKAMLP